MRFSPRKGETGGRKKEKHHKKPTEKVISVKIQRPTTAKPKARRARSASSTSRSSVGHSSSETESRSRSSIKEKHHHWYSKLSPFRHKKKSGKKGGTEDIKEETVERVVTENRERSKKDKVVRVAIEPRIPTYPSVFSEKRPRSETRRRPSNDYNFYRDPNIPGHAFPYYYLSYLLSMDNGYRGRSKGAQRVTLVPAPIHGTSPHAARPNHRKSAKQQRQGKPGVKMPNSPPRRERKTKSVIDADYISVQRSTSRDSRMSSANQSSLSGSHPRIRPGSGPIKCSWKEHPDPDTPKYPGSDHQLKNTNNPVIKEWLRRKDAQLRARKLNEVRKQRRKTSKLIDEQNDKDEKQERALEQYEIWKRQKDRLVSISA